MSMKPRDRVLGLFEGKEVDRMACYSGMGNVTTAGLEQLGYKFAEVHTDPVKMANSAATSYKLFGYECAVVPYDMCVEAEALGCVMNTYEDVAHLLYPTIKEKLIHSPDEMTGVTIPDNIAERGRFPLVMEAISLLKKDIGDEVAIGSWFLGPFTLAGQLMDLNDLFKLVFKKPNEVNILLDRLADLIITMAARYREAGADYITIREMGAPTDVLSPRSFRQVIKPHLEKIFKNIPSPKILHICGDTNLIIGLMNECGADAISVETKNDLAKSRATIGSEPLLFGHVDGYNVLCNGTPEDVEKAVLASIEGGVDAVWPSCDIWPTAPLENLRAMVDTVKKYGSEKWARKNR
ncbi:MtaA/CmuA family methyltransferase [Desulfofundulus sp. TPOSR]|uniref:MtaA/CmuA family methyltransferase n=1 Tax=Desulfofundulus sp. TPOSR TaxID=2714340 RepID=UPI00140AA9DF|nr:MtaA/CmuA family methyltransferase [Desulfofundulus sp. TPOSR]NHM26657.1 MtaA/CmuA family methyltransferase [Desulfofundulus sp. TPOSR]